MEFNTFLTAATVSCPQRITSIPSTARPALMPVGWRMAGTPGRSVRAPHGMGGRD